MEIQQMRYFITLCEEMNYTKAAERLFITRQALRKAVQNMEEELHAELLINQNNHLYLTSLGEKLQLEAKSILKAYDGMQRNLNSDIISSDNILTLGMSVSLFPYFAPETGYYLDEFQVKYPQLRMDNIQATNEELLNKIKQEQIDAALMIYMDYDESPYSYTVLKEEELCIILSKENPLSIHEMIDIESLQGKTCLVMGDPQIMLYPLVKELEMNGVKLQYQIVPQSHEAVYYLIKNNQLLLLDSYEAKSWSSSFPYRKVLLKDHSFKWHLILMKSEKTKNSLQSRLLDTFLQQKYKQSK